MTQPRQNCIKFLIYPKRRSFKERSPRGRASEVILLPLNGHPHQAWISLRTTARFGAIGRVDEQTREARSRKGRRTRGRSSVAPACRQTRHTHPSSRSWEKLVLAGFRSRDWLTQSKPFTGIAVPAQHHWSRS